MALKRYVIWRLIYTIPLILGVSMVVFLLVRLAPGDPVTLFFGMREEFDFAPADIERIRHKLGLDQPVYVQYLQWV